MTYSTENYKEMAKRFNSQSFTGKLIIIKNNPTIFRLEEDCGWLMLRLQDNEAMEQEIDFLFEFPNELSSREIRDMFTLLNIKLH